MQQPNDQVNHSEERFKDLLEEYDYQLPKPGDILQGIILSTDEEGILVDVGLKRDAIVSSREFSQLGEEFVNDLKPGDQVVVYLLNQPVGDQELHVSLTKGIEHQSWEKVESYLQSNEIVELEIVGKNRGGFLVKFEKLVGFLPFSQVPEVRAARSPGLAEKIKQGLMESTMPLKVIEVVRPRNRLIFSALDAQAEKRKQRLEALQVGQIIEGKVVNIVDFGAFVDLEGVDGLVHVSQLAWEKIKHPTEVVKIGDEIQVKVTQVDVERERVSLSRKALLPSPWDLAGENYKAGDYIEGVVMRVVDFGAFVRLSTGIEGLIHLSQLGYSAAQDPHEAVKRGERVLVRVLDVNPERRRISLSMRQVPLERQIAWAMGALPEVETPPAETRPADSAQTPDLPPDSVAETRSASSSQTPDLEPDSAIETLPADSAQTSDPLPDSVAETQSANSSQTPDLEPDSVIETLPADSTQTPDPKDVDEQS